MQIRIKSPHEPQSSEITPRAVYGRRREILKAGAAGLAWAGAGLASAQAAGGPAGMLRRPDAIPAAGQLSPLDATTSSLSTVEPATPYRDVTTYNNF